MKKKIDLCSGDFPDTRVFFCDKQIPVCDVCVAPWEWLSEYFSGNNIPLPFIAYGSVELMSSSIALGCADYLCTPWTAEEFFLRTRLCYSKFAIVPVSSDGSFISLKGGRLSCRNLGKTRELFTELTATEHKIFVLFTRNRGVCFSRKEISAILGRLGNSGCSSRAVDMNVSRLRSKIKELCNEAGISPAYEPIYTSKGSGWGIL